MDAQNISTEFYKLSKELEGQRTTLSDVIRLIVNLNNAINEGFNEINNRLSALEGKQGMQGVNTQLNEIKIELHKIQRAYPYEEIYSNLKSISGEA